MTQQERQNRLELESNFRRRQPKMPPERKIHANNDRNFKAAYGRSCVPDKPPRVKGDASGRKIAVKAEGTRSWGSGLGNNVSDTMRGVNGQSERMEERIERKLPQWRKERRDFKAKGAPKCIILPGRDNGPVKKAPEPTRYVTPMSEQEQIAALKVMPTWSAFGERTLAVFRSKWR